MSEGGALPGHRCLLDALSSIYFSLLRGSRGADSSIIEEIFKNNSVTTTCRYSAI